MKLRIFTLRFDELQGRFDETALQHFIQDKELIGVDHHFFAYDGLPCLAVVITYRLSLPSSPEPIARKEEDRAPDWRSLLQPEEYALFNSLRVWRAERSKADGIPPYVICTNRQLVNMVQQRPASLAQLAEVEGFGKVKREKYGQELLGFFVGQPKNSDT